MNPANWDWAWTWWRFQQNDTPVWLALGMLACIAVLKLCDRIDPQTPEAP